jgi:hypothetical protein
VKVGFRLFVSSALFGIAIAVVYWYSSHDPTGTMLLGLMAAALIFAAGFMLVAEREADLAADKPRAAPSDEAGMNVGTFTLRSPWPIVAALGGWLFLFGLVLLPAFAVLGFGALAYALYRLIRESR